MSRVEAKWRVRSVPSRMVESICRGLGELGAGLVAAWMMKGKSPEGVEAVDVAGRRIRAGSAARCGDLRGQARGEW